MSLDGIIASKLYAGSAGFSASPPISSLPCRVHTPLIRDPVLVRDPVCHHPTIPNLADGRHGKAWGITCKYDVLFVILGVGPRKPANQSHVTDVCVIDQSSQLATNNHIHVGSI